LFVPGPHPCPYSPKCLEDEFCELRLYEKFSEVAPRRALGKSWWKVGLAPAPLKQGDGRLRTRVVTRDLRLQEDTGKDEEMKIAFPSLRVSTRATLTLLIALLVGAIALLSLGTRPAETKPTSAQPLYTVQDLGTLPGGRSAMPSASTKPAKWSEPRIPTKALRALRSIPSSTAVG
jgi:hypothetical protein